MMVIYIRSGDMIALSIPDLPVDLVVDSSLVLRKVAAHYHRS